MYIYTITSENQCTQNNIKKKMSRRDQPNDDGDAPAASSSRSQTTPLPFRKKTAMRWWSEP